MNLLDFSFTLLKQYAKEQKLTTRSTSDLSPLEIWLINELWKLSMDIREEANEGESK